MAGVLFSDLAEQVLLPRIHGSFWKESPF
jgi:hypothetical protein